MFVILSFVGIVFLRELDDDLGSLLLERSVDFVEINGRLFPFHSNFTIGSGLFLSSSTKCIFIIGSFMNQMSQRGNIFFLIINQPLRFQIFRLCFNYLINTFKKFYIFRTVVDTETMR